MEWAILPCILEGRLYLALPFMCAYVAMIATLLAVILWYMDSVPALQCNGYRLESWLAQHLEKGSAQCRGCGM